MNAHDSSPAAEVIPSAQTSPIATSGEEEPRVPTSRPVPMYRSGRLRSSKIMIAEDDPAVIESVRRDLQAVGYCDFVSTSDPDKVFSMLRRESPEILILDVMEDFRGLELLERIRTDRQFGELPVIMLTALSDSETRSDAKAMGATDFLSQPVDPNELALRVRNVLTIKAHQARVNSSSQRIAIRYEMREGYDIPATLRLAEDKEDKSSEPIQAEVHDLATGGARLRLPVRLETGQQMHVTIKIDEIDLTVSVEAATRWVQVADDHWELGCEFAVDLSDDVFETLARAGYLERRHEQRWRISLEGVLNQELAAQREVNVLVEDYSPGGIRVFSPEPINVGDRLLLYIRDLSYELISIPTRAMWQVVCDDGYKIGCAFLNKTGYSNLVHVVAAKPDTTEHKRNYRLPLKPVVWLGAISAVVWSLCRLGMI